MAATASEMEVSSSVITSPPRHQPIPKSAAQITSTASATTLPKAAMRFCNGVAPVPWSSRLAMRPISVRMPVATTTPSPRPFTTTVPL